MRWVRIAADAPAAGVDTSKDPVTIDESGGLHRPAGRNGHRSVEFSKLTYGSGGRRREHDQRHGGPADYYFDMDSVKRTELRVDGRKEHLVKPPERLYAGDRSCLRGGPGRGGTSGGPSSARSCPSRSAPGPRASTSAAGTWNSGPSGCPSTSCRPRRRRMSAAPRASPPPTRLRRARHHRCPRPAVPDADVQLRRGRRPARPRVTEIEHVGTRRPAGP